MRRGEEVMWWRGGNDSFALGQLRNNQIAGCGVGGSEVGYPIYGGGNRREDNAPNVMVLGISNAFLGHNPLSGFRSV